MVLRTSFGKWKGAIPIIWSSQLWNSLTKHIRLMVRQLIFQTQNIILIIAHCLTVYCLSFFTWKVQLMGTPARCKYNTIFLNPKINLHTSVFVCLQSVHSKRINPWKPIDDKANYRWYVYLIKPMHIQSNALLHICRCFPVLISHKLRFAFILCICFEQTV